MRKKFEGFMLERGIEEKMQGGGVLRKKFGEGYAGSERGKEDNMGGVAKRKMGVCWRGDKKTKCRGWKKLRGGGMPERGKEEVMP